MTERPALLAKQASYTVYIVDDDAAVRDSLVELLEIEGFAAQAFASGKDFLDHFHPAGDTCLLLDIQMQGMDGIELLEILGRRQHHLPIIVMSGNADRTTKARVLRAGAAQFLDKPLDIDQLIKFLEVVRG